MPQNLTADQQSTYNSIFNHPLAHSLKWADIKSMFGGLGNVVDESNGDVKVTRNGQTLILHPVSSTDEADVSALMQVRHFLRSSDPVNGKLQKDGEHFLVVIDHREARVFKTDAHGSKSERIVAHDPHGFGRHVHNMHDQTKGQHHRVPKSYFEAVAKTLESADQILLFGSGSGGQSAMHELIDELRKEHKDVFDRLIGAEQVDEKHMTENQLLAKARKFYEALLPQ